MLPEGGPLASVTPNPGLNVRGPSPSSGCLGRASWLPHRKRLPSLGGSSGAGGSCRPRSEATRDSFQSGMTLLSPPTPGDTPAGVLLPTLHV